MKKSLYQILGVRKDVSPSGLEVAFRALETKYRTLYEQGDQEASNELISIRHAYATLSNPEKRSAYDEKWAAMQFQPRLNNQLRSSRPAPTNPSAAKQNENPNLKNCSACGQLISRGAKSCPHCGDENRDPTSSNKLGFTSVLLVVFFLIFALGKFGNDRTSTHDSTKASESSYNQNISGATTSNSLSDADLAWHAQNTYGWDCSEVISRGGITSGGYFPIQCSSGTKLRVYLRPGQHPKITNSNGGYE